MVRLMSGLLRLRKKFQNSLLLDHVVKTAYQRGGHIGVPAPFLIAKIKILLLYCKKTYKMHVYFYVLYLSLDSISDRDIHSVRIAEPLI